MTWKVGRSVVLALWCALFMAVPMIGSDAPYGWATWLSLVEAMILGGLLVFMAMMPEKLR
jgi:hypothetical protein